MKTDILLPLQSLANFQTNKMRKVNFDISVEMTITMDEGQDLSDVVAELDITTDNTAVTIEDFKIDGINVMDSK